MARAKEWILIATALMVLATACISSLGVDTTDAPPTPLPTIEPVLIPTTAPANPTPTSTATTGAEAELANTTSQDTATETPEATPTPTVTPFPTATPAVIELTTPVPVRATPTPRPTSPPVRQTPEAVRQAPQPVPQPVPQRAQQPAPQPTRRPAAAPAGCPGGTTARASDGQCVRFCSQSELTIRNDCVCTGDLYDTGGQCVKRCLPNQIPNGSGGCKFPEAETGT